MVVWFVNGCGGSMRRRRRRRRKNVTFLCY
jgi:hypothetical protein